MAKTYQEMLPQAENSIATSRLNRLATTASNEFIRLHPGLPATQLYEGIFNSWQEIANANLPSESRGFSNLEPSSHYIRSDEVTETQGFLHVPSTELPKLTQQLFEIIDRVISPEGKLHESIDSRKKLISFLGNIESLLTILHIPKDGCGRINEDFMRAIIARQKQYHISPLSSNGYRYDSRVRDKLLLETIYKEKFATVVSRSTEELHYGSDNRLPMREVLLNVANTSNLFKAFKEKNGGEFKDPWIPYSALTSILFEVLFDKLSQSPTDPIFDDVDKGWQAIFKFDSDFSEFAQLPENSLTRLDKLVGWTKYWLPILNHGEVESPKDVVIRGNKLLTEAIVDENIPPEILVDYGVFWLGAIAVINLAQHDRHRHVELSHFIAHKIRELIDSGKAHDRARLKEWSMAFSLLMSQ